MRSAGVAWLLDLYGFRVYVLTGGYKSFRRWCRAQFTRSYPFTVIGGYTGSGKTAILRELKERGAGALDLEELASHRGSVFGHLGKPAQPTQEMFENLLAMELASLSSEETVFVEDESQRIGTLYVPIELFRFIQTRLVLFLDIPFEQRLEYIAGGYGKFEKEKLAEAIDRIRKRLGGLETITAMDCLEKDDIVGCFRILLKYYDKYYLKGLEKKNQRLKFVRTVSCESTNAARNARSILLEQDIAIS
jgi:tRNA 2-selenouridine synthase